MALVERSELLKLGDYEGIREPFRARVIAEKKARRVHLGDKISAVFENHDTVLLQIQEMLRTERITKEPAIAHEIETYNQLVPRKDELSLTAMIEIDERATREKFLVDARGIEKSFALVVTVDGKEETCKATWDAARAEPDRASAVLYLKLPLTKATAEGIRNHKATAILTVEHDAYAAKIEIPKAALASLAEDLSE
ncbi:MAG: DUF3501 family protein [Polyangiaceae bacterium]